MNTLNYTPSRAGDLFDCVICGRIMPCKIYSLSGHTFAVCIDCIEKKTNQK